MERIAQVCPLLNTRKFSHCRRVEKGRIIGKKEVLYIVDR